MDSQSRIEKADAALLATKDVEDGSRAWLNLLDIAQTQAYIAQAEAIEEQNLILERIALALERS